ncbi:MAG: hypothetical protein HY669_00430 [Chloroflexi bacterium]|nr:hypothetical protein [Chloroflexota bacterium]
MASTKLRAVVASEHLDARHLLTKVAEKEPGVVVVGQAENAIKAVALARSLRPEVIMVDSRLPHVVGLDTVRLSRISGLDVAMGISQELPKSRVIVLANLNATVSQDIELNGGTEAFLYRETTSTTSLIQLQKLYHETALDRSLVFANVEVREQASLRRKVIEASEKATLYSGLAILGGLGLMLTLILAAPGAALALAGAAGLVISLAGRLAAALWPRRRYIEQEPDAVEVKKPKKLKAA